MTLGQKEERGWGYGTFQYYIHPYIKPTIFCCLYPFFLNPVLFFCILLFIFQTFLFLFSHFPHFPLFYIYISFIGCGCVGAIELLGACDGMRNWMGWEWEIGHDRKVSYFVGRYFSLNCIFLEIKFFFLLKSFSFGSNYMRHSATRPHPLSFFAFFFYYT
jgi:hypothetical protein